MSDRDSNGFIWFLAGLGLGAALGILYAPKSGRETREAILQAAENGRDAIRDRARQMKEHANEWVDRGKEYVQQQKEQLRSASDAFKHAYREATEPPKNS